MAFLDKIGISIQNYSNRNPIKLLVHFLYPLALSIELFLLGLVLLLFTKKQKAGKFEIVKRTVVLAHG